jgi:DNA-binding MarR family transcriptional regulator
MLELVSILRHILTEQVRELLMESNSSDKVPSAKTRAAMEEAREIISKHAVVGVELDERGIAILISVSRGLNGHARADDIAHRMGYRPARSGRLAVTGTLRKLEGGGLIGRSAPRDQWSAASWFLTPKARALLKGLQEEPEPSTGPKI